MRRQAARVFHVIMYAFNAQRYFAELTVVTMLAIKYQMSRPRIPSWKASRYSNRTYIQIRGTSVFKIRRAASFQSFRDHEKSWHLLERTRRDVSSTVAIVELSMDSSERRAGGSKHQPIASVLSSWGINNPETGTSALVSPLSSSRAREVVEIADIIFVMVRVEYWAGNHLNCSDATGR